MPVWSVPNPWRGLGEKVSGNRIGLLPPPLPSTSVHFALGALCLVWLRGSFAQWLSISCTCVAELTATIILDKCVVGVCTKGQTWHWKVGGRVVVAIGFFFFFPSFFCACTSHYFEGHAGGGLMRGFLPE